MGYAVFGGGREKVFTIAYGERDSGKSAFFGTFMRMLNDFAVTISPDALLKQKFENEAQTGLSHISGARLYVSSETQAGAQLNIPLLKRFASGGSDAIRTRAMRKDFIDIIPRGLLVIQTNNIPENEELDDALWSRTIILPFEGSFPTDDPDTIKGAALDAKMISQREGILQWLIEGYESYLYMGLRPPRSIERALTRVRDLQDWVTPFVAEFLDRDDSKSVGRKDLRLAYELWCRNTDTPIVPNHGQWTRLIDTGLGSPCERGTGNKMVWKGWAMKGIECATELPTSMRSDL
jgi:putative DNA primase/helicase